ncbi:delta(5)-3-ketosteroid isomerase [Caenibius tardaugens NBRC 16725]|uniref:Delta(5)-3-ketosteroid isomerase n=1 Tax=Caenibius tardaugens NBRC 16725 TaxID=1219035 RepID=U2Y9X1_9SPHN|nr:nuclear transport factor 2 family protein [Caenibius tardaugens]AZI35571.1 3-ketosteroid 5-isomerase [Caenibius tardaugens NBRC 16725]GAD50146.1 delta(5)-3-ketosteroid isomerase [Caenibius tardaugens NBRC 16725]
MTDLPEMASGMLGDATQGVPGAHIRDVFKRYGEAHSAGDVDAILALFADDAVVRDPANAPEHRGKSALRAFFEAGIEASGGPIAMTLEGNVRIAGNEGAAAYIVRTINSSPVFRVDTLDVMTFNEQGLIAQMIAYWGPENFQQEG